MATWFDIIVRGILGMDQKDDKEMVILGRIVRWTEEGILYEADPKHRRLILEYFGFEGNAKGLSFNGKRMIRRKIGS